MSNLWIAKCDKVFSIVDCLYQLYDSGPRIDPHLRKAHSTTLLNYTAQLIEIKDRATYESIMTSFLSDSSSPLNDRFKNIPKITLLNSLLFIILTDTLALFPRHHPDRIDCVNRLDEVARLAFNHHIYNHLVFLHQTGLVMLPLDVLFHIFPLTPWAILQYSKTHFLEHLTIALSEGQHPLQGVDLHSTIVDFSHFLLPIKQQAESHPPPQPSPVPSHNHDIFLAVPPDLPQELGFIPNKLQLFTLQHINAILINIFHFIDIWDHVIAIGLRRGGEADPENDQAKNVSAVDSFMNSINTSQHIEAIGLVYDAHPDTTLSLAQVFVTWALKYPHHFHISDLRDPLPAYPSVMLGSPVVRFDPNTSRVKSKKYVAPSSVQNRLMGFGFGRNTFNLNNVYYYVYDRVDGVNDAIRFQSEPNSIFLSYPLDTPISPPHSPPTLSTLFNHTFVNFSTPFLCLIPSVRNATTHLHCTIMNTIWRYAFAPPNLANSTLLKSPFPPISFIDRLEHIFSQIPIHTLFYICLQLTIPQTHTLQHIVLFNIYHALSVITDIQTGTTESIFNTAYLDRFTPYTQRLLPISLQMILNATLLPQSTPRPEFRFPTDITQLLLPVYSEQIISPSVSRNPSLTSPNSLYFTPSCQPLFNIPVLQTGADFRVTDDALTTIFRIQFEETPLPQGLKLHLLRPSSDLLTPPGLSKQQSNQLNSAQTQLVNEAAPQCDLDQEKAAHLNLLNVHNLNDFAEVPLTLNYGLYQTITQLCTFQAAKHGANNISLTQLFNPETKPRDELNALVSAQSYHFAFPSGSLIIPRPKVIIQTTASSQSHYNKIREHITMLQLDPQRNVFFKSNPIDSVTPRGIYGNSHLSYSTSLYSHLLHHSIGKSGDFSSFFRLLLWYTMNPKAPIQHMAISYRPAASSSSITPTQVCFSLIHPKLSHDKSVMSFYPSKSGTQLNIAQLQFRETLSCVRLPYLYLTGQAPRAYTFHPAFIKASSSYRGWKTLAARFTFERTKLGDKGEKSNVPPLPSMYTQQRIVGRSYLLPSSSSSSSSSPPPPPQVGNCAVVDDTPACLSKDEERDVFFYASQIHEENQFYSPHPALLLERAGKQPLEQIFTSIYNWSVSPFENAIVAHKGASLHGILYAFYVLFNLTYRLDFPTQLPLIVPDSIEITQVDQPSITYYDALLAPLYASQPLSNDGQLSELTSISLNNQLLFDTSTLLEHFCALFLSTQDYLEIFGHLTAELRANPLYQPHYFPQNRPLSALTTDVLKSQQIPRLSTTDHPFDGILTQTNHFSAVHQHPHGLYPPTTPTIFHPNTDFAETPTVPQPPQSEISSPQTASKFSKQRIFDSVVFNPLFGYEKQDDKTNPFAIDSSIDTGVLDMTELSTLVQSLGYSGSPLSTLQSKLSLATHDLLHDANRSFSIFKALKPPTQHLSIPRLLQGLNLFIDSDSLLATINPLHISVHGITHAKLLTQFGFNAQFCSSQYGTNCNHLYNSLAAQITDSSICSSSQYNQLSYMVPFNHNGQVAHSIASSTFPSMKDINPRVFPRFFLEQAPSTVSYAHLLAKSPLSSNTLLGTSENSASSTDFLTTPSLSTLRILTTLSHAITQSLFIPGRQYQIKPTVNPHHCNYARLGEPVVKKPGKVEVGRSHARTGLLDSIHARTAPSPHKPPALTGGSDSNTSACPTLTFPQFTSPNNILLDNRILPEWLVYLQTTSSDWEQVNEAIESNQPIPLHTPPAMSASHAIQFRPHVPLSTTYFYMYGAVEVVEDIPLFTIDLQTYTSLFSPILPLAFDLPFSTTNTSFIDDSNPPKLSELVPTPLQPISTLPVLHHSLIKAVRTMDMPSKEVEQDLVFLYSLLFESLPHIHSAPSSPPLNAVHVQQAFQAQHQFWLYLLSRNVAPLQVNTIGSIYRLLSTQLPLQHEFFVKLKLNFENDLITNDQGDEHFTPHSASLKPPVVEFPRQPSRSTSRPTDYEHLFTLAYPSKSPAQAMSNSIKGYSFILPPMLANNFASSLVAAFFKIANAAAQRVFRAFHLIQAHFNTTILTKRYDYSDVTDLLDSYEFSTMTFGVRNVTDFVQTISLVDLHILYICYGHLVMPYLAEIGDALPNFVTTSVHDKATFVCKQLVQYACLSTDCVQASVQYLNQCGHHNPAKQSASDVEVLESTLIESILLFNQPLSFDEIISQIDLEFFWVSFIMAFVRCFCRIQGNIGSHSLRCMGRKLDDFLLTTQALFDISFGPPQTISTARNTTSKPLNFPFPITTVPTISHVMAVIDLHIVSIEHQVHALYDYSLNDSASCGPAMFSGEKGRLGDRTKPFAQYLTLQHPLRSQSKQATLSSRSQHAPKNGLLYWYVDAITNVTVDDMTTLLTGVLHTDQDGQRVELLHPTMMFDQQFVHSKYPAIYNSFGMVPKKKHIDNAVRLGVLKSFSQLTPCLTEAAPYPRSPNPIPGASIQTINTFSQFITATNFLPFHLHSLPKSDLLLDPGLRWFISHYSSTMLFHLKLGSHVANSRQNRVVTEATDYIQSVCTDPTMHVFLPDPPIPLVKPIEQNTGTTVRMEVFIRALLRRISPQAIIFILSQLDHEELINYKCVIVRPLTKPQQNSQSTDLPPRSNWTISQQELFETDFTPNNTNCVTGYFETLFYDTTQLQQQAILRSPDRPQLAQLWATPQSVIQIELNIFHMLEITDAPFEVKRRIHDIFTLYSQ